MKHLFTFSEWLKGKWESFATFATFAMQNLKNLKSLMPIFVGNEVRDIRVMVGKVPTNYQLISNLSPTVTRYFIRFAVVFSPYSCRVQLLVVNNVSTICYFF